MYINMKIRTMLSRISETSCLYAFFLGFRVVYGTQSNKSGTSSRLAFCTTRGFAPPHKSEIRALKIGRQTFKCSTTFQMTMWRLTENQFKLKVRMGAVSGPFTLRLGSASDAKDESKSFTMMTPPS